MPNVALSVKEGSNLAQVKQAMLTGINRDVTEYIVSFYDIGTQQSFTGLYAKRDTPDAVRDYLDPVWTWISTIMAYYYGKKADIEATETVAVCAAITWDFTTFTASKPDVSLQGLLAMA